jgi:hypothetical protein
VSVASPPRLLVGMKRSPSRLRAVLAAVATVSAIGLVAGPATAGGPVPTHLSHAPLGPPPGVLLMEGRSINRPDGTSQHVPIPRLSGTYWSLVGPAPGGYLLVNYDNHLHLDLYRLSHGARHLLARTRAIPEYADVLAADHGRRVAFWSQSNTAEHSVGKVYDARGRLVTQTRVAGSSRMLDFDGDHAVVSGPTTSLWTAGSAPVQISADHAYLASLRYDLLFVRTASGRIGPTSVTAPGTPSWTAPFKPTGLSADGRLVVGDQTGHTDRIQVRRVSDGHVVADLAVRGHVNDEPLVLENDHRLLVEALVAHRGLSLFRCGFSGHCVRTWGWLSGSLFSGAHFSGPGLGTGFRT